ncbi:MAG TPA: EAL domain-containing protein [Solirubrobacteraceae bacterium]|nr:EAL domain-containing protein [Solirubrobacteraceae bacterium]
MPGAKLNSDQRLSLIVETQRCIAAAGDDLQTVMQVVADRSQSIIGADGSMVNLLEGDMIHTRAVSGIAAGAFNARRPISGSVARYAIRSGQPVLIEDTVGDPRIDQVQRAKVGDTSLICVPLFRGEDVIGTLNVMSCSERRRLNEDDRETLEMLSVMLGAAVSQVAEFEARRAQARAISRFRTLFDGASIGILRLDPDGVAVEVNPALEEMLGASAEELIGSRFTEHLVPEHRKTVEDRLIEMLDGRRDSFQLEARCMTRDDGLVWALVRAVVEHGEDGGPACAVAMIENITERKRTEQELIHQAELNEHQALHDPLTALPNRLLFGERIGQAIRYAERNGSRLAVVLMDLDRFKEVNDSLGHAAGDQLLRQVGERMSKAVRASDTVARLGGDEFGLLLPDLDGPEGALPVVKRIRAALERPVYVHSLPLAVEASVGIAVFPDHGSDAQTLIQRADVAMYDSKRDSASFTFYDEASHDSDISRLTLVAELRRAITARELLLHYQPKAALESGEVRSVEALLRWNHPERGMVYPDSFIPLAQETGLIGPLTLYVIEEALRQGREWRDAGFELSISVNLSTRNLLDRDFPNQVAGLLSRWGMSPEWLELEVTESSMLANPTRAKTVLNELSALGLRLSIDDFGTGYSSLAYLRQLPVDEIKIDRSFVIGMGEEADDAVIVRSTVDLGRNLGLEVVAEGVETLDLWNRLRELGCQTAQGYFLSRPVPADELAEWLRARRPPVTAVDDSAAA